MFGCLPLDGPRREGGLFAGLRTDVSSSPIRSGTACQVRAGEKHSPRNLGDRTLLILVIYDPPRERKKD